jgi:Mlc titration factor MtfA (ptsG expression regulator)
MSLFLYQAGLPLTIALSVIAIVALWIGLTPVLQRRRRRRLWRRPFPAAWDAILREELPGLARLPTDLMRQLKAHLQVFLDEKPIVGCGGLVVDDRIRVTIAAQACLLLLNRRDADYYPELRQVLVYPDAFVVERLQSDSLGLQYHAAQVLSGESWSRGQVVLSWQAAREGARQPGDGRNVVIHEFAHQLDQEFGPANGAPLLARREDYARWSEVLGKEYTKLREALSQGEPTLLDPYGATDPAEFFACASELFFERPRDLAIQHPALYNELRRYYCVDPIRWY